MPFQEITTETQAERHTGAAVGLIKIKGAVAKMRISLRRNVMEEMSLKEGDRLAILLGDGEDHGLVRLRKDKAGSFVLNERHAAHNTVFWQVTIGHRPEFVDRSEKSVPCNWEKIDLTTFEIVLPPWSDETRPRAKAGMSATPPNVAAGRRDQEARQREAEEAAQRRRKREAEDGAQAWDAVRKSLTELSPAARFKASLKLTNTEAAVLGHLVDHAGQTVRTDALSTLLYADRPNDPPSDRIIDVWVHRLRRKIDGSGCAIETDRGVGFRLTGDPTVLLDAEAA